MFTKIRFESILGYSNSNSESNRFDWISIDTDLNCYFWIRFESNWQFDSWYSGSIRIKLTYSSSIMLFIQFIRTNREFESWSPKINQDRTVGKIRSPLKDSVWIHPPPLPLLPRPLPVNLSFIINQCQKDPKMMIGKKMFEFELNCNLWILNLAKVSPLVKLALILYSLKFYSIQFYFLNLYSILDTLTFLVFRVVINNPNPN